MVTKEDFDKEHLEWIEKQMELRRQLHRFITVKLYSGIDEWLVDDEHMSTFIYEYIGTVVDEIRDNLSKENFEKVKLLMKESGVFNDLMYYSR
jgi:uncharacterized protein (UPF0371 family)